MSNQEFGEQFLQSMANLREPLVQELLEKNSIYQQVSQLENELEKQYLQLDLTDEQRRILEQMLMQKERSALLYADAAYLAGCRHGFQLYQTLSQ